MEPLWRYNLDECQITLNITVDNSIDVAIQVAKSVGFALHVVFFIVVAAIKEFHTQSSIFLINLGLVSFLNLIDGIIAFDPDFMCLTGSKVYCAYQSIFIQYYSYLYSYAIVLLAFYRLLCSSSTRLIRNFKTWKMWISLAINWIIPFVLVVISKFALNGPVYYSDVLDACRISYKRRRGGFIFFLLFGFVFPTLIVAAIYACILFRVKNIKKKVMNANSTYKGDNKISCVMVSENHIVCHRSEMISDVGRQVNLIADVVTDFTVEPDDSSIKRQNSRKALTTTNNNSVNKNNSNEEKIKKSKDGGGDNKKKEPTVNTSSSSSAKNNKQITKSTKPAKATSGMFTAYTRQRVFSVEFKLLVQFLIIFFSYFIYSISNILLTYQLTVTTDNRWDKELLKVFRLLIWLYHLFNPVIFLSFHPIFISKCLKNPSCKSCSFSSICNICN